jgi:ribonucleoside-diphosphate reductase beta chain
MAFQTFNPVKVNALLEPMFFGASVNVSRYDQQKHEIFEKLIEKQLSFFWRPEEVALSRDAIDFSKMNQAEQHIYISNLKYQTLLDSIQGRSPNIAFLPIVSIPELETWIETWSFSETVHSRSYTHIMRNVLPNMAEEFDNIVDDPEIQKRATAVTKHYDDLILYTTAYQLHGLGPIEIKGQVINVTMRALKEKLYLTLVAVNILEGLRFYVSFACSFAFVERKLMEGNGKIMRLIARDESLHLIGTQAILNLFTSGKDDPEMVIIAKDLEPEVYKIVDDALAQEKDWAKHLFKYGSMLGLNTEIICQYAEYIANIRLKAINLEPQYATTKDPLPWMYHHLNSDGVQDAPQEVEKGSYLIGQIDAELGDNDFDHFDL